MKIHEALLKLDMGNAVAEFDQELECYFAKVLIDLGFLEPTGESYKVPILYREGLNMTQGKAF